MENNIFREKSVERVSSPEQLDSYLKVTSPKVWIILGAIIVLLVGMLCWAFVGKIETSETASCYIEDGKLYCYTTEEVVKKLDANSVIKLDGSDINYEIAELQFIGVIAEEDAELARMVGVKVGDRAYELVAFCDLPNTLNMQPGKIVLETVSPITFIFN